MLLFTILTLILSQFTREHLYFAKFPAIAPFGFGLIFFLIIIDIILRFYSCPVCEGYGAINLTFYQKLINDINPGKVGDKCPHCNGSGLVDMRKYYLENAINSK